MLFVKITRTLTGLCLHMKLFNFLSERSSPLQATERARLAKVVRLYVDMVRPHPHIAEHRRHQTKAPASTEVERRIALPTGRLKELKRMHIHKDCEQPQRELTYLAVDRVYFLDLALKILVNLEARLSFRLQVGFVWSADRELRTTPRTLKQHNEVHARVSALQDDS